MRSLPVIILSLTLGIGPAPAAMAEEKIKIEELVDRITWGKTSESVEAARRLGSNRWIEDQLHAPLDAPLPQEAKHQVESFTITRSTMVQIAIEMDRKTKSADKIKDIFAHEAAHQEYLKCMQSLLDESIRRSLLRNIYSPSQLREQMTWFWFNHFNVQADKLDIRAMVGDYEDQAIRPNALGKFRDLLKAADLHPAMLRYLDNDQNTSGRINENFAREILELHTMGVGSGYTQTDVEELARVLTGVGVSLSTDNPPIKPDQKKFYIRRGLMEFNPARHDFGSKVVLGKTYEGMGLRELEEVLDMLARRPETAKHISTKISLYFIGDAPPSLINRMSHTYLRSDGDIASTLRTLFKSREFAASLGKRMKDPNHYAISAIRLAYEDRPILNAAPLQGWIARMGQPLYGRETPDGYPVDSAAWSGPGQLTTTFEIARQIGSNSAGLFKSDTSLDQDIPAFPQLQNALFYSFSKSHLSDSTKNALLKARSPSEWNTIFLSSPEFLHH